MKSAYVFSIAAIALATSTVSMAQSPIWRCGNAYTNDSAEAKANHCKLVEGGNVTVVNTRVNPVVAQPKDTSNGVKVATAPQSVAAPVRIDSGEQRTRDADARAILETELKKAQERHSDLLKEWNNGDPEKMGPEHRNHQKYIDRVAELKASISRTESDINGLKRELGRAAK